MMRRRAKLSHDGKCIHRYMRAVHARQPGAPGTRAIVCCHCAAFRPAFRWSWFTYGNHGANTAPPPGGWPLGAEMALLSDVVEGSEGYSVAQAIIEAPPVEPAHGAACPDGIKPGSCALSAEVCARVHRPILSSVTKTA